MQNDDEPSSALPMEISRLMEDVQFGTRDTVLGALRALVTTKNRAARYLPLVRPVVLEAMQRGDGVVQLVGAEALAALGDDSDLIVRMLLAALSSDEPAIKFEACKALAYVRGRQEVVDELMRVAQFDETRPAQMGALLALGAIGNPSSMPLLEYRSREERWAKVAVDLFGQADFAFIHSVALEGAEVRQCVACGQLSRMTGAFLTVFTGKYNCPHCGNSDQHPVVSTGARK